MKEEEAVCLSLFLITNYYNYYLTLLPLSSLNLVTSLLIVKSSVGLFVTDKYFYFVLTSKSSIFKVLSTPILHSPIPPFPHSLHFVLFLIPAVIQYTLIFYLLFVSRPGTIFSSFFLFHLHHHHHHKPISLFCDRRLVNLLYLSIQTTWSISRSLIPIHI